MTRRVRVVVSAAAAPAVAGLLAYLLAPRPLNADERRLAGIWCSVVMGSLAEYRSDRTLWHGTGRNAVLVGHWRVSGDTLLVSPPNPPTLDEWVRSLFAPSSAAGQRIAWESPDVFFPCNSDGSIPEYPCRYVRLTDKINALRRQQVASP